MADDDVIVKDSNGNRLSDGDSVTLDGKVTVNVTDDIPAFVAGATGHNVVRDESAGNQGNEDDGDKLCSVGDQKKNRSGKNAKDACTPKVKVAQKN